MTTKAALPLLFFATLASAQTPPQTPPPIQMGLWQEDVTTTITGINGVTTTPQKDVEQSCITPESWMKNGLQATNANNGCTVSNLHQEPQKLSYDVSCGSQGSSPIVFHMVILIDSNQQMHGTAAAVVAAPSSPHQGLWNSTLNAHYISPNCGDLKPGEQRPSAN